MYANPPGSSAILLVVNLLDQYRRLSQGFNQAPTAGETWTLVVVVAGIVTAIIVLARFVGRERRVKPPPKVDYLALSADLLGLSELEAADLRHVAHYSRLEHPVAMLLSPANLAWAVHHALGRASSPERRERLERLALKLYGVPLPVAPRSPKPDKN